MNKKWWGFCLAAVVVCAGHGAHANILKTIGDKTEAFVREVQEENEGKGSFIGLGAIYASCPYSAKKERVLPVPIVMMEYKDFFIDKTVAGYRFYEKEHVSASLIVQPRLMGYDSDDSDVLYGMESRHKSVDGGLRLKWKEAGFVLTITGVSDLLNQHQGQEVSATLSRECLKGFLRPRVGVKWVSQDLNDYYYGVKSDEVNATRTSYQGKETVAVTAGLGCGLPIGEKWVFVADFSYEDLTSDVEDSPLVDAKDLYAVTAGLVYRF